MQELGILLSLILLMFMAYRGFSVILFAPVFALLAAVASGYDMLPTYTEMFMPRAVGYVKNFFPVFMLGAVFGKVMEDTGMAKTIAKAVVKQLGHERAMYAVVLSCAILVYGGVSLFVVAFAVYPFAASLFREANIPKRLIPAAIAFGAFTWPMDALPGSPQIPNIIPTKYFATTAYAAPVTGLIGAAIMFTVGMCWLEYRRKKARAADEGYGEHKLNEPEAMDETALPSLTLSLLPLVVVMVGNFALTRWMLTWDKAILAKFPGVSLASVVGIWALIVALVAGIAIAVILGWDKFKTKSLASSLHVGVMGSLLAIMNTASEVGYGNVIAMLPGFQSIAGALMSIKGTGTPLLSEAVTVTTLAGITGSGSGGLSIALEIMGKEYLAWANQVGLSPELLHRIGAMACGGMDTLPHNGAVITLLAICGLTHRQSYADIFAVTVIKTTTVFILIAIVTLTGIV